MISEPERAELTRQKNGDHFVLANRAQPSHCLRYLLCIATLGPWSTDDKSPLLRTCTSFLEPRWDCYTSLGESHERVRTGDNWLGSTRPSGTETHSVRAVGAADGQGPAPCAQPVLALTQLRALPFQARRRGERPTSSGSTSPPGQARTWQPPLNSNDDPRPSTLGAERA